MAKCTIRDNKHFPLTVPNATQTDDGAMSSADKIKLDALPGGGTNRALLTTDFAFGPASWGATANISALRGTQDAFVFNVATSGGGQQASPSVDLTFPAPFPPATPPIYIVEMSNCDDAATLSTKITWTVNSNHLVLTFNGLPANNKNYEFTVTRGTQ